MTTAAAEGRAGSAAPASVAFFDFDGTLIRGESSLLCAPQAARRGLVPVSVAGRFLVGHVLYKLGLKTRAEVMKTGLLCFRGGTLAQLREVAQELYEGHLRHRIAPAMRHRVEEHRARGDTLIVLTASTHFFAEPIGRDLRFDEVHGTRLSYEDEVCTGRVDGDLLDGDAKLRLAGRLAAERGVSLSDCAFYSDHIADLPLLEAVGRPFAVQPHPPLARVARERAWPVLAHDLPCPPLDGASP